MERTIKFRTKREYSSQFEYFTLEQVAALRDDYYAYENWDLFTGLTDKAGKEIFENDVVKFHYFYGDYVDDGFKEAEHELTGVITWGAFGWCVESIKGEHWKGYAGYNDGEGESSIMELYMMNQSGTHEESFEVIGDIHTNTELLNQ